MQEAILVDAALSVRQAADITAFVNGLDGHRLRGPNAQRDFATRAAKASNNQQRYEIFSGAQATPMVHLMPPTNTSSVFTPIFGDTTVINTMISRHETNKTATPQIREEDDQDNKMAVTDFQVDDQDNKMTETGFQVDDLQMELKDTHRPDKQVLDKCAPTKIIYTSKTKIGTNQRRINGIRFGKVDENDGKLYFLLDICGGTDLWIHENLVDAADIQDWQQLLAYHQQQKCVPCDTTDRSQRYRTLHYTEECSGTNEAYSQRKIVHMRNGEKSQNNQKLLYKAKLLSRDRLVVLKCRGTPESLCMQGQVTVDVLFI